MSSQEQVSTLLHYSFWRNGHGHFSIILNIVNGSFQNHPIVSVLKSPLNYFLADSSTMVHHTNSIIGKKLDQIWCHDII